MAQGQKQFFFIDDSGSRNWDFPYAREFTNNPPNRSDDNLEYWRKNYFVLAGLHISGERISVLNKEINLKKQEYFGTTKVEIKSEWFRFPYKRKKHYLDKYNITEERLREFMEDFWYSLFTPENFTIQAFVLDKRYYASAKRNQYKPIAILTQVIFDRISMYPADKMIVVFDQMDKNIKSTKNDHGVILKVSSEGVNTSDYCSLYKHSEVRFEDSFNSNFLQISDTIAHNIFRQFVHYGDNWEDLDKKSLETYPYFEKMISCIHHKNNIISGIGVIKVPDFVKKKWTNRTT